MSIFFPLKIYLIKEDESKLTCFCLRSSAANWSGSTWKFKQKKINILKQKLFCSRPNQVHTTINISYMFLYKFTQWTFPYQLYCIVRGPPVVNFPKYFLVLGKGQWVMRKCEWHSRMSIFPYCNNLQFGPGNTKRAQHYVINTFGPEQWFISILYSGAYFFFVWFYFFMVSKSSWLNSISILMQKNPLKKRNDAGRSS